MTKLYTFYVSSIVFKLTNLQIENMRMYINTYLGGKKISVKTISIFL